MDFTMGIMNLQRMTAPKTALRPKVKPRGRPPIEDDGPKPEGYLWIVEWIYALGHTPAEVQRATGVNAGYLSELKQLKKDNPSRQIVRKVADFPEIPTAYFERKPPSGRDFGGIDPAILSRLKS